MSSASEAQQLADMSSLTAAQASTPSRIAHCCTADSVHSPVQHNGLESGARKSNAQQLAAEPNPGTEMLEVTGLYNRLLLACLVVCSSV